MLDPAKETAANPSRPHGRSLDDFRDQSTESQLLPAEDKLLVAVLKGNICDVTDSEVTRKCHAELETAISDPDVVRLAAEVIANPFQLFRSNEDEEQNKRDDENAVVTLEHSLNAHPRIVREFLTALPGFAKAHPKTPKDLKARVASNHDLLLPIFADLKKRFELGHWCQVDPANPEVRVRAAFLRFLALGGDGVAAVHERGVVLKGAYVDGAFDLTYCDRIAPLKFDACFFSERIDFSGAWLQGLSLSGCCVPAVEGPRFQTESSVILNRGFSSLGSVCLTGAVIGGTFDCGEGTFNAGLNCDNGKITGDVILSSNAKGGVSVRGATIGGNLNCSDAIFSNQTDDGMGRALDCEAAKIEGSVVLKSANVEGRVFLIGIKVGYSLELNGVSIRNHMPKMRRPALQCQGAKIKGPVLFRSGLVEGGVGFAGAEIDGTLDCASTRFSYLAAQEISPPLCAEAESPRAEPALDLQHAIIKGALWLRKHESGESAVPTEILGSVDLTGAHARMLVDHPDSWPKQRAVGSDGQRLSCAIRLDGFTYDRFSDGAPTDAEHRLLWLSLQPTEHLRTDFRPQPFEQVVKVLREMGHERDARQVAIAKLRNRRWARLVAIGRNFTNWPVHRRDWAKKPFKLVVSIFDTIVLFLEWLILDVVLGSGYAKIKPVLLFLLVLLGCWGYYDFAAKQSAFVPTNPVIYKDATIRQACAGNSQPLDVTTPVDWYACKKMPFELNPFRPLVYSVDQMIPFLQLGQKRDWQPVSRQLQLNLWGIGKLTLPASTTLIVTWCQSIGSTMLYLFIAAILSGLIKRD